MSQNVSLIMTIPYLQSAITMAGDGGGRIKLDFDDQQTEQVIRLLAWRGKLLRVTIEPIVD